MRQSSSQSQVLSSPKTGVVEFVSCVLTIAIVQGCGGNRQDPVDAALDGSNPDSDSVDAMFDAEHSDSDTSACLGADGLPCLETASGAPARFDCSPTAPVPGDPLSLTIQLRSDELGAAFSSFGADLVIEIHPGDEIVEPCAGACTVLTADSSGNVIATLAAPSWFAYRIAATGSGPEDVAASVGYRIVRETDTTKRVAFVTNGWLETSLVEIGREHAPGSANVFGTIFDCDDQFVAGATVRVFSGDVEITMGSAASDPFTLYYSETTPAPEAAVTGSRGWYSVSNAPVPEDGRVRVEVHGTLTDGGVRELVACEEAVILSDGYTTRPMRPLRSDYPVGNTCADRIP